MKNFSKLYFFLLLISQSQIIYSQDSIDLGALDKILESGDASAAEMQSADEFESITKNEYDNIANQIRDIDDATELKNYRTAIRNKRIDLAIRLCIEDKNACYLIDKYQEFSEDMEVKSEDGLEIFGVDMFSGYPLNFDQSDSTGVPNDYVFRNGDLIELGIFGSLESYFFEKLRINSDGDVVLKKLGSFKISGLTKDEAQTKIKDILSVTLNAITGVSVSLKSTAPIKVYSLGAVQNPGLYKLSTLSSPINALIASGGLKDYSSLRKVSVLRGEKKIKDIDLYQFLIYGKNDSPFYLLDNDVLQVNSSKGTVSILGEVSRPAKYEILNGENLGDLIKFALGFTYKADQNNIIVKSRNSYGQYITSSYAFDDVVTLKAGDQVIVQSLEGESLNFVELVGEIRNQGVYEYKKNMVLSDLIDLNKDFLNTTYKFFGLIRSFNTDTNTYSYKEFNLFDVDSINQISIQKLDKIFFLSWEDINFLNSTYLQAHLAYDLFKYSTSSFDISVTQASDSRNAISGMGSDTSQMGIEQLQAVNLNTESNRQSASAGSIPYSRISCMSELRNYGPIDFQEKISIKVNAFQNKNKQSCPNLLTDFPELLPYLLDAASLVLGDVSKPGLFPMKGPLKKNILSSLSGNLIKNASSTYTLEWSTFDSSQTYEKPLNSLDALDKVSFLNFKLKKRTEERYVTIKGEVKSPGTYPILPNSKLSSLIERAGGYTQSAYPFAGIFSRESIKEKELGELKRADKELREIFSTAISTGTITQNATDVAALLSIISEVENAKPVGRLVTEFNLSKLRKNPQIDIYLENGDEIYIPSTMSTVTIVGSVLNPITVPYNERFNVQDYIKSAGGVTKSSDESKIYVLLPNGQAIKPSRRLFGLNNTLILPGSSVVVPRDARPLSGFALVETLSPVLANLSITAASLNSINSN